MALEDRKIDVKLKLAALWCSLVLIYLYADLFGFYIPGHIDQLRGGEIAGFQITQVLLLGFMILMTIPSLMVFLSLTLKAKMNRWTNIIVALLQLVFVLAGIFDPNIYFIFASGVEIVLLLLIIWYAWTWPTQESSS
ncbi:MAG: hypothetical protein JSW11_14470 [Candidatus Heimdallarchaeota archaeon]|nr:MAG: hypothetical protein JSW11_14470 [Candidatus Heimdallarchaeota archaeon]